MKILVRGLGHISALGQGLEALKTGLKNPTPPPLTPRRVTTAEGEKNILTYACPEVVLPNTVPEPVARRMSRIAKMCFAAVDEAVKDAFGENPPQGARWGLAVGTAFGAFELANNFQRRIYLEGPGGASPSLFAGSVQNSIAAQLSTAFKIQGPSSTVMTMEQSAFNALRLGMDWIQQDIVDHTVVVIGDEISNYHAYTAAHQPQSEALQPLSPNFSAIVGEGATAFVLSKENGKYARLAELELAALRPPPVERLFSAAMGLEGQSLRYQNWLGTQAAIAHSPLYGSLLTGGAFEALIAALSVAEDGIATGCIQITTHDEAQSAVFCAP